MQYLNELLNEARANEFGKYIQDEAQKELTDLQGRAAALTSLLVAILGKDYEGLEGFEEATRQAIHTWNDVAEAARYYDNEDEFLPQAGS